MTSEFVRQVVERKAAAVLQRRRGKVLERAILAAVRSEIVANGYAGTTFDGVAAAAATSKPVLYRRWRTKADMVVAALTDSDRMAGFVAPDTGSLAGDIAALLRTRRDNSSHQLRSGILGLLAETGSMAGEAVRKLVFARQAEWLDPILSRARARGELGPARLPAHVLQLPYDLLRHDLLIVGKLDDRRIAELVRLCIVPLFTTHSFAA